MNFLVQDYADKGYNGIVSSSGGNAGYSAAWIAAKLGLICKVMLPVNTPSNIVSLIEGTGARAELFGENWNAADEKARAIAKSENLGYVHPFDHPLLWEGHATMMSEYAENHSKPEAVVVAVGGGGLLCGVAEGLNKLGWQDVDIIACETEGAASYARALDASMPVDIEQINSIASSLGARKVAQAAFDVTSTFKVIPHICTDSQALDACFQFANDQNIVVGPACGAALSTIYCGDILSEYNNVLVIVCGGIEGTALNLSKWQKELL